MEWISKIFDVFKLNLKHKILIVLFSFFLLTAPLSLKEFLGIAKIVNDFRLYISLFLIFFALFLFVDAGVYLFDKIKKHLDIKKAADETIKSIKMFDPYEKKIIKSYFDKNSNTHNLPLSTPAVVGLIHKKILIVIRECENPRWGPSVVAEINPNIKKYLSVGNLELTDEEKSIVG